MHIRPARDEDTKRLGELAGALVRLHHSFEPARFFHAEGIEDGYGRWLAKSARSGAVVLVAEDEDGRVVGYTYATVEPRNWNDLIDTHGKIHDVLVDPTARRKGYARAVVLATAVKNPNAQALFRSMSFEPTMIEMTHRLTDIEGR
jgi:ribosomal protein S18 acetylase RimI-like enzyme